MSIKPEPQPNNLERINFLYSVLEVSNWNQERPLFHEYVTEKLAGEPRSLLELLTGTVDDLETTTRLAEKVWVLTLERDRRVESIGVTETLRDDTILDNLTALGTEG